MLRPAINSNITIKVIENFLEKYDIRLSERYKTILSILIPGLIYRDGKIIIMSMTINQINKVLKRHRDDIDFVSILLGFDIITDIDKYGVITIPIAVLLNKVTINKEVVCVNGKNILRKKVLTNAVQTLAMSELLSHLNIPKELSIPIISLILDLFDADIDKEFKMMSNNSIAFANAKFSDTKKILRQMEFDKIILNIMILSVINYIGFSIGSSLLLVNIFSTVMDVVQCEYRMKTAKGFLGPQKRRK
jgi:hypothetical protein